jgi:hypothetical protein
MLILLSSYAIGALVVIVPLWREARRRNRLLLLALGEAEFARQDARIAALSELGRSAVLAAQCELLSEAMRHVILLPEAKEILKGAPN